MTSEHQLRPRRSVLYMPAANERALEKAKDIPADSLIFDLEDAVSPDAKDDARVRACTAFAGGGYGNREIVIRANGLGTQWHHEDLRDISEVGPAAVLVPKIDSAEQIRDLESELNRLGAPPHTKIWAMLETPIAMLNAYSIASSSDRLTVLVMGTNDLAKELHARRTHDRHPLLFGLSSCLLAARAAGKVILDGVFNDIKDEEGLIRECRQGHEMGFDGKTLIHPSQVGPCNEVFAPTEEEVANALKVIEAFELADAEGRGVVTVDGRMIENLHVDEARRVLVIQEAIEQRS